MAQVDTLKIRKSVRNYYGAIAGKHGGASGCCAPEAAEDVASDEVATTEGESIYDIDNLDSAGVAAKIGYTKAELEAVPEGANMGLGCGNPTAIAALRPGETVVDLGSGGGFDCFLAAEQVGAQGRVIGVDMTPEMIEKARLNAQKAGRDNVEFRLGEIEHLPVADGTVDTVISNCVINLSPAKRQVYEDAFRVLKPGGRLCISDIVALQPIAGDMLENMAAYAGCVSGAALVADIETWLRQVGFAEIKVDVNEASREVIAELTPGCGFDDYVAAATITAVKG